MVRDTTGKAIGVLIVMPELFYGGAETQFRYLAEGLVSRGLRVTLLIIDCYVDAEAREEVEWINEHPGIHVERLSGYGGRNKLNSFLPLYKDILKCINLNKINITIVYDSLSTWLTPLICRHCAVLSSERNEGHPGRLLEHIRYLGAGKITCNSKVAFDNLSNDGFDPLYIPNGLPNKNPIPYATHKPKRILVPARICRMKNQVVVLEALENLSPEREYSVRFAGAIEDREYFDRIAKMPRGNHKIEFLGFVDNIFLGRDAKCSA